MVTAGSAATITVLGANFNPNDTLELLKNGNAESGTKTEFVSSHDLHLIIPASDITTAGTLSIRLVENGMAVSSKPVTLTVVAAPEGPPVITSISPTNVTAGGPGFTLTINGTNLDQYNIDLIWSPTGEETSGFTGIQAVPIEMSATQLTFAIPAAAIAYPGTITIALEIALPDSPIIESNSVMLTINPAPAGISQFISIGVNGAAPNASSSMPMVSDTGRSVVFASDATNLVSGGTAFPQDYVRDTCIGAPLYDNNNHPLTCTPSTTLISAVSSGTAGAPVEGNGSSTDPSIGYQQGGEGLYGSNELQYFTFLSSATNLVLPNTTSRQGFIRDTNVPPTPGGSATPLTILISDGQNNTLPNGPASDIDMDSEGCNVAFVSAAINLIAAVTTPNEVYLSECQNIATATYTTVSVVSASTAGVPGNQGGSEPSVVGTLIAFASTSTNLTTTPNGGFQQIYLRNLCDGTSCTPVTTIVSVDSSGNALAGNSENPSISDDGRFITYTYEAPQTGGGTLDTVYRYDSCVSSYGSPTQVPNCTPGTATISAGNGGVAANGSSDSGRHAMSADGRFVIFHSSATNLIAGGNPAGQVFVRDTCVSVIGSSFGNVPSNCAPTTTMISLDNGAAVGGSQETISGDGHFAAFVTTLGGIQQVVLGYTGD